MAEKEPNVTSIDASHVPTGSETQNGVRKAEAITSTWSARSLIIAYIMIWLIYFVEMAQAGVTASLVPYVTSAFAEHSLTPTVTVFSSIIGAVLQLSLAKILDIWGRPQGYLVSIILASLGLVMMAICRTVEMYAAAQVFYALGNNSIQYCLSIFIADTSSLTNRGLLIALSTSPNIITSWLSGPIAERFLNGAGWRWGFGAFSIILPLTTLPLYGHFMYNLHKSKALVVDRQHEHRSRTWWQSFIHYSREFDAIGILLLSVGLALFLLPFSIYSLQPDGWRAPLIISLLIFGSAFLGGFVVWEKFFAPVNFFPYSLLSDRTVLGAYVLGTTLFMSYYCWASYFTSFLQVVNGLSVTQASYVSQTYNIGASLWAIVTGYVIRRTGRYKPVTLYFAVPLSILGLGLMINFCQPGNSVGYIIMCQILISIAGGTIVISDGIAAMGAASHQHVAVVLAVDSMFSQIGGAVGLTAAATIWQNVFLAKLLEYLPTSELPNVLSIYGDLNAQLSYPTGSAARLAIQHAYAEAQKWLLTASSAVWIIGFIAVLFWRDVDVRGIRQVEGRVF